MYIVDVYEQNKLKPVLSIMEKPEGTPVHTRPLATPPLKQCSRCKQWLLLSEFCKDKSAKDGLHLYCKECKKQIDKKYNRAHKKEIAEYKAKYMRMRRQTDLKVNLNDKISHAILKSLKGNKAGRSWEELVGYTVEDLQKRLKKTMPKGYNWDDFLNGKLHIDHIIPKSVFQFESSNHPDFQRCWALKNLRLLPAKENLKKHAKHEPFQPMLMLKKVL